MVGVTSSFVKLFSHDVQCEWFVFLLYWLTR
jgi:hypothetical protein